MKKAILIPVFNEEKSIQEVVRALLHFKGEFDIVVVDDGSFDRTPDILREFDIKILRHCINSGYGAALQTGLRYLYENGYEYAVLFDGDGQHPPEYVKPLLMEADKTGSDIVIGSRFLSDYKEAGFFKGLALRFFSLIIYLATRVIIRDPTSGFKCLNRRAMRYYIADIMPLSFPDADALILAIRSGLKIREVAVRMRERISGRSMHYGMKALTYMFNMLFSILICILRSNKDLKMED